MALQWLKSKENLTKQFEISPTYNIDETGLSYQLLQIHRFALRGETCKNAKHFKVRITAVFLLSLTHK